MMQFRYLNYFLISIISSGLTYHYFNTVTKGQIINLKEQVQTLLKENESLRKELELDDDIKKIVEKLDECLTLLIKNIMEIKVQNIDDDLNDEIKNICKRIISYLPEKQVKINPEYENSKEAFNLTSYDTLVSELSKLEN